jgi:hypothetical protein
VEPFAKTKGLTCVARMAKTIYSLSNLQQIYSIFSNCIDGHHYVIIVGADPGANHYVENLRRCSLHRRGRSAVRGRTVRDLAQGSGSLPDGPNGPCLEAGRSARAQGRWSSPAAPKSRSWEEFGRRREILGFV